MSETKKNGFQLINRLTQIAQMDDGTLVKLDAKSDPLTWAQIIYKAFCTMWKQDQQDETGKGGLTSEKKKAIGKLASKIIRAKPGLFLSAGELADIEEYTQRLWGPGIYGPIQNMIDGEYEDLKEEPEESVPEKEKMSTALLSSPTAS